MSFRLPYRDDLSFSLVAFLLLVVPLAFTLNTYEHYEVIKYALLLILLGLAVLARVKSSTGRPLLTVPYGKSVLTCLGLFLVSAVVATVWSGSHWNSFFGFYPRFSNGLVFYASWAVLLLLLGDMARDLGRYRFLLNILVVDAVAVAVFGIMQSYGIGFYMGLESTEVFQRSPSFLGNANFASLFVVCMIPFMVVFFAQSQRFAARIYYALALFAAMISVIFFSSRAGLLGLLGVLACLLIMIPWSKSRKTLLLISIASLVASALLYVGFANIARPGALTSTVTLQETNINQRLDVWELAFTDLKAHPFGGFGLGNFQLVFEQFRPKYMANISGVFDDSHNLFLQMATTGGVQLALSFLGLLVLAVATWFGRLRRSGQPLHAALIASLAGFSFMACFTPVPVSCFILLAVLIAGLGIEAEHEIAVVLNKVWLGTAAALAVLATVWGMDVAVSEFIFSSGYQSYLAMDYQAARKPLKIAAVINPSNQLYYLYYAGSVLQQSPEDPKGQAMVQQMIRYSPDDVMSYVHASSLELIPLSLTGRQQYADLVLRYMDKAISLDPYCANRYGRLGDYLMRMGKLDDAREVLKSSLTLDNSNLPIWILLAKVYQLQDKRPQALYALSQAHKLRPDITDLQMIWRIANKEADIKKVPIPVAPLNNKLD